MKLRSLLTLLPIVLMFATVEAKTSTVPGINDVTYASKLSDEPVLVQSFSVAGKEETEVTNAIWKATTKRGWKVNTLKTGISRRS